MRSTCTCRGQWGLHVQQIEGAVRSTCTCRGQWGLHVQQIEGAVRSTCTADRGGSEVYMYM